MAHKVHGAFSQNFSRGFAEIIEIVDPGLTQLTKAWETNLAKFSKPMRDEVYGRFYCVYEKTMDSAKGLAKLRENQECDVLQDKFFEVVSDVETSNKIMMKFKQNLPAKDILEAIAGLSAKGKERISKELKRSIADAKKSELEMAFENVFGKMDPQSHRLRHLFVLENIQNENRGMSYVEEHLSHLDATFAKDIRRILKREFYCEPKKATLMQYNDAARILIQELKNPKKSDNEKTKKDPETEKGIEDLDAQLAILKQLQNAYSNDGDLINKLRGSLNKENQESYAQHLQVFNSQPEYASISSYKAAVAVYELLDLSKQVKQEQLNQLKLGKMEEGAEKLKLSVASENTSSSSSSSSSSTSSSSTNSEKTSEKISPEDQLTNELEVLEVQLAILQQIKDEYLLDPAKAHRERLDKDTKAKFDGWLKTNLKVTPDTVTDYIDLYQAASGIWYAYNTLRQEKSEQLKKLKQPKSDPSAQAFDAKPEAEAKPKFDAAKEIARYDTQIGQLQILIAKSGKTHLTIQNEQLDVEAYEDVDVALREGFETNFGLAKEEDMVKAAKIVVERYRFGKQVAILKEISQTNGETQLRFNVSSTTVGTLDAMLHDHLKTDYQNCTKSQLAVAARYSLQQIEDKKVKTKKDFQTSMDTLANIIRNNGHIGENDELVGTCMPDLNKILNEKFKINDWTVASEPQTLEAAKILLRKYLMRPNPLSTDWHETGIQELKRIIADNGKVLSYPGTFVLKNLDAILMDKYGVVLQKYTHLNDDAKVLAAANTLLRRYEAVQA
jgi:hypothetical protein